jgi:hypothetical protein
MRNYIDTLVVSVDSDTSKLKQGRLYDWNNPEVIKIPKQFEKGSWYGILET